jgi:uncharacterized protein YbcI
METATGSPGISQTISAGMVSIYKDQLGRGPAKARTWVNDNVVVTVLADSLNKAESMLAQTDNGDKVRAIRRGFQTAMEADMKKLVEEATQREVICVFSDHSPDPDLAVEVILLAPKTGSNSNGASASAL